MVLCPSDSESPQTHCFRICLQHPTTKPPGGFFSAGGTSRAEVSGESISWEQPLGSDRWGLEDQYPRSSALWVRKLRRVLHCLPEFSSREPVLAIGVPKPRYMRKKIVSVSLGCRDKIPETRWLKQRNLFSHGSGS